jgi:hypothetical protein
MLVRDKQFGLLDPFISYVKMKCCEYAPRGIFTKVLGRILVGVSFTKKTES